MLVGALGALVPVGPVVWAFLWVDRWEPEPPRTLLFAFLWGACVAALTALIINSSAAYFADAVLGQGSGDVLGAAVIAPFVEEGVKGAFVVGLLLFRRREFDGVVDGIVYAGLTAAGFAFTENILYIGRSFAEDGGLIGQNGGVLAVLVLRGVLSPFAHPLFTSMTGIGCGLAAVSRSPAARVLYVLVGYLAAVTLHALWNGSATFGDGQAFLVVYLYVMAAAAARDGRCSSAGSGAASSARCAPSCPSSPRPAGSRRARCRCSAASPGATAGGARCAGGRARPRRRPSPSTRRPSRSWPSCARGCGGGRSARTRGSGTTSGSPPWSRRGRGRWGSRRR